MYMTATGTLPTLPEVVKCMLQAPASGFTMLGATSWQEDTAVVCNSNSIYHITCWCARRIPSQHRRPAFRNNKNNRVPDRGLLCMPRTLAALTPSVEASTSILSRTRPGTLTLNSDGCAVSSCRAPATSQRSSAARPSSFCN